MEGKGQKPTEKRPSLERSAPAKIETICPIINQKVALERAFFPLNDSRIFSSDFTGCKDSNEGGPCYKGGKVFCTYDGNYSPCKPFLFLSSLTRTEHVNPGETRHTEYKDLPIIT